jgi:hypothetical protein
MLPEYNFIISDQHDKQIWCGNLPGKNYNEIRSSFVIESMFFSFFIFTCVEFFPSHKILQNDVNSFSGYILFLFIFIHRNKLNLEQTKVTLLRKKPLFKGDTLCSDPRWCMYSICWRTNSTWSTQGKCWLEPKGSVYTCSNSPSITTALFSPLCRYMHISTALFFHFPSAGTHSCSCCWLPQSDPGCPPSQLHFFHEVAMRCTKCKILCQPPIQTTPALPYS